MRTCPYLRISDTALLYANGEGVHQDYDKALDWIYKAARNGKSPSVIDSNDLLENSDVIVSAFCNSVGIPFLTKAMSWKAGKDPSAHSWWDDGSFYANLAQSTGLKPQIHRYLDIADTPERVQRVHMRMKPHYEHLYRHRIKAVP